VNWALGFIHATRVFMARVQRSCEQGYSVQTLSLQAVPHQIESAWVLSVQSHKPPQLDWSRRFDRTPTCDRHRASTAYHSVAQQRAGVSSRVWKRKTTRYDTIRDAILTCARKPTSVSLIYRTETTTENCKTEKLISKN